jgi:hypothetical protein
VSLTASIGLRDTNNSVRTINCWKILERIHDKGSISGRESRYSMKDDTVAWELLKYNNIFSYHPRSGIISFQSQPVHIYVHSEIGSVQRTEFKRKIE